MLLFKLCTQTICYHCVDIYLKDVILTLSLNTCKNASYTVTTMPGFDSDSGLLSRLLWVSEYFSPGTQVSQLSLTIQLSGHGSRK